MRQQAALAFPIPVVFIPELGPATWVFDVVRSDEKRVAWTLFHHNHIFEVLRGQQISRSLAYIFVAPPPPSEICAWARKSGVEVQYERFDPVETATSVVINDAGSR